VDSPIQRDRLRAERCDMAQGYLYSRPLDYTEAELQLMKTTNTLGRARGPRLDSGPRQPSESPDA
jgi:predicted signal transduction protein with EAL and GGDEF domain